MKIEKAEVAKDTIRIISAVGVGSVLKNIWIVTTPAGIGVGSKVILGVGKLIISTMVMEAADKYVEKRLNFIHLVYEVARQSYKDKMEAKAKEKEKEKAEAEGSAEGT